MSAAASLFLRTEQIITVGHRHIAQRAVDVVICGGGVIGSSLTLALQKRSPNTRTLLIDSKPKIKLDDYSLNNQYFTRCLALNKLAFDILNEIEVWPKLKKYRNPHPVSAMKVRDKFSLADSADDCVKVWDYCSNSDGFELSNPNGDHVAHIVENDVLSACLHDSIEESRSAFEANLVGIEHVNDDMLKLQLSEKSILSEVECKLLVIAGGWNQSLLRNAGFRECIKVDYEQSAITCVLEVDQTERSQKGNEVAYQRFLPTGPIAILPLSESHSCMIWSADEKELAPRLRAMNDAELLNTINDTLTKSAKSDTINSGILYSLDQLFTDRKAKLAEIGRYSSIQPGSRHSFPLIMALPDTYVQKRIALMGDSAHRIHPLAGQGANLGFADLKSFLSVMDDYVFTGGDDIGSLTMLNRYHRDRQFTALSKALLMDALKRLYGTDFSPIVWARTLGSEIFKRIDGLQSLALKVSSQG